MGGEVEQCIHVLRMTLSGPKLDFKVFFTSFLLIYISKDHHRPETGKEKKPPRDWRCQFLSLFNCVLFFVLIIINRVQFRVNTYL